MEFIKYATGKNGDKKIIGLTKQAYIIIGVALLVVGFWIFCFRTVGAGEVGIITRFGEVNRIQTSGIAIKAPWPVESITYMETRVQKEEQDSNAATADLQDVNGKLALNYALDNETALRVYKELGEDYKNRIITPAVQESFKSATASFTASELITKRGEVKAKALEVIKNRLEKYGIRVVDLNIVNFSFSAAFNQAIEAKQIAQQNAEKATQDLARIKVEAEQTIAKATADAEAQRLQQTTLTDEIIRMKQLETQQQAIAKWNGVMPTTNAGDGSILSIPLR